MVPSTVSLFPFLSPPTSFSFFSLQRLRDSGGWLVQKCRHTFLDLSGWPWKSSWWRWTSTHRLFLLLFPLTLLLWPLITLDMTVISWLYSQSRDISATFGSPLFLVLTVPHSLGDDKLPVTHSRTCSPQFCKASSRRSCSLPLGKGTSRWDQSRFLQWSTTLSKCKTPVKLKWRKWVCLSTEVQTYMTSGSQMFSIFQ